MADSDEKIGRAVFGISYFIYALKRICVLSLITTVFMWVFGMPLWYAPIIGVCLFLIYRMIRRLIFGLFIKLGRWGSKQ